MSTTKTTSGTGRARKSAISEDSLMAAYIKALLTHGKAPASVFAFTDSLGIQESDFYKFFSSFEALEMAVWDDLMKRTLDTLNEDEKFASFSAREKLLAFYFTHLEVLKERRSYVAMKWPHIKTKPSTPKALKGYKDKFMNFANTVVEEGIEKRELKDRKRLSEQYDKAFWFQLLFIVGYWSEDSSKDFEMSDAAVEKAVNLTFQLLGESAIDGAIDLAKFLWQSK